MCSSITQAKCWVWTVVWIGTNQFGELGRLRWLKRVKCKHDSDLIMRCAHATVDVDGIGVKRKTGKLQKALVILKKNAQLWKNGGRNRLTWVQLKWPLKPHAREQILALLYCFRVIIKWTVDYRSSQSRPSTIISNHSIMQSMAGPLQLAVCPVSSFYWYTL